MGPEGTTESLQSTEVATMDAYPTYPIAFGGIGVAFVVVAAALTLFGPRRSVAPAAPVSPAVLPPPPVEEEPPPEPEPDAATVPGAAPRTATPTAAAPRTQPSALLDDTLAPVTPKPIPAPEPEAIGIVARLRQALGRSREALQGRFDALFGKPIDEALFEELEETLLLADVGVDTATRITDRVRETARSEDADADALRAALRSEMADILTSVDARFAEPSADQPLVILVVGVNGSGKTTTIGKLAAKFSAEGHSVLLAAADTYRAAAVDQLKVWSERTGADFVSHDEGADPGAVVYDALEAARARSRNVVIIDTAGRLQTRKPLMEQLSKLRRVVQKHVPDGPHETLLVLDGTMGQNGLSQARLFNEATPLSGVVVTKLDGTAKGGMVLTIAAELGLPVKFIGIGEGVDDLRPFEPAAFVEALA